MRESRTASDFLVLVIISIFIMMNRQSGRPDFRSTANVIPATILPRAAP